MSCTSEIELLAPLDLPFFPLEPGLLGLPILVSIFDTEVNHFDMRTFGEDDADVGIGHVAWVMFMEKGRSCELTI